MGSLDEIPPATTAGVSSDWTKTLSEGETQDTLKAELAGDSKSLARLGRVIEGKYKESLAKDENLTDPNYAERVAAGAGYRKALKEIYRLLEIRPKNVI